MASAIADIKIRALQERAAFLIADAGALADMAKAGAASPELAVDIGRTLGIATVIGRLADLLANGGIPVSLLGLIERECTALVEGCYVK